MCLAMTAAAEGYQVNTLSARQNGMGHTGVAQKLGAESMYFNPAGLGFMESTVDLSGSFNAVMATASAKNAEGKWTTDNDPSTPMMFNAAFSIYDNLKAGINLYTPYGSGINWGDSWAGAILNQSVSLKAFTVQPTFSWRITPKLSVGAGLTLSWGSVDLSKGLIVPSTADAVIGGLILAGALPAATPLFNGTMPASVNLTGKSAVAAGFNVGIMYDIDSQWTVGAQFRSKSTLRVKKGQAAVSYANEVSQSLLQNQLGLINNANFAAEMPLPSVITFGASYKPVENLLLALDLQYTGWSTYKHLDIEFLNPNLTSFNQHLVKDYKNSWAFRLGAQWGATERLDLRAGLILDLSPVNKEHYNPETPGMTKIEPSLGLSFRPIKSFSIDLSVLYVAGLGAKDASCSYPDLLASIINPQLGTSFPTVRTFTADYSVHAWVPSIGLTYSF